MGKAVPERTSNSWASPQVKAKAAFARPRTKDSAGNAFASPGGARCTFGRYAQDLEQDPEVSLTDCSSGSAE